MNDLLSLEGDTGGRVIINSNIDNVKFIEVEKASFLWDIDTEEDYKMLLDKQKESV